MAVAVDRGPATRRFAPVEGSALLHPVAAWALMTAGVAVTVLVARDGSLGSRAFRVVAAAGTTLLSIAALQRWNGRRGGRCATAFGILTFTVGAGFLPHLIKNGLSVTSIAAAIASFAGLGTAIAGSVVTAAGRKPVGRVASMLVTLFATAVVACVVSPAVMATNVPRPQIGANPASKGLRYESVVLATSDGVHLAAWYLPGTNRAGIVLLHGAGSTRSSVLDQAAVLAEHGFGVLLVDARGHGESGGRAMDFGWYGDRDIEAAIRFLTGRADVDSARIGVMGMSMGGEEALGASASNALIRAVVAEGATARSAADEAWLSDEFGWRGVVQEQIERVQDVVTDALTSASPPISNRRAVEMSTTTRYLIIAAGEEPDEIHAGEYVAAVAPDRVELWTVAGSGHTEGLATAPENWERRVINFLSSALLGDGPDW